MPSRVSTSTSEEGPRAWGDLVGALGEFGFSEKEASLYLAGLRRVRATARELTTEAGIDRVFGYRLLNGLRARGAFEVSAERPRRFLVTPPRELLART